jgi:hypothetical protein
MEVGRTNHSEGVPSFASLARRSLKEIAIRGLSAEAGA